jgi:hypothetical protein
MEQVTTIQYIPMWMVNVSPMNPRKTFDQASLEELADNIKRQGLLQPITVRPVDYRDDILRKWLRGKLSDSGVQYYPIQQKCQERLIEVWGIDDVEVKAKAAAKLRKKQEKIEKALTKLGYDTEGKKLAF